jgi:hypothetical protein
LGAPVAYFFEGQAATAEFSAAFPDLQAFLSSREGIELAQAFINIENPAMRRAFIDIARAAAGS